MIRKRILVWLERTIAITNPQSKMIHKSNRRIIFSTRTFFIALCHLGLRFLDHALDFYFNVLFSVGWRERERERGIVQTNKVMSVR